MIRRAHYERQTRIEREVEQFVGQFELVRCEENKPHGRWLLKGGWSWAEVVTLAHGLYVGGDIETVCFSGHPRGYGVRSAVYWMATRSYGYASEKARMGGVETVEWDRACARESLLEMRREKVIDAENAREIFDLLGGDDCSQSRFQDALYEAQEDVERLDAGEVVARRIYLATAVLRRLTWLLECRDFRVKSREWLYRGNTEAA